MSDKQRTLQIKDNDRLREMWECLPKESPISDHKYNSTYKLVHRVISVTGLTEKS